MKLAFSSNAYLHYSIENTIEKIASLGYSGIEILADVPHAWPAGLLDERKQSIRDSLNRHRLTISNVNAFMMNAVADPSAANTPSVRYSWPQIWAPLTLRPNRADC